MITFGRKVWIASTSKNTKVAIRWVSMIKHGGWSLVMEDVRGGDVMKVGGGMEGIHP